MMPDPLTASSSSLPVFGCVSLVVALVASVALTRDLAMGLRAPCPTAAAGNGFSRRPPCDDIAVPVWDDVGSVVVTSGLVGKVEDDVEGRGGTVTPDQLSPSTRDTDGRVPLPDNTLDEAIRSRRSVWKEDRRESGTVTSQPLAPEEDGEKGGRKSREEVTLKERPEEQMEDNAKSKLEVKAENEEESRVECRFPQAIIIGVKKGGTRALLEFLKVHPDIRAPGPEIHFFDRNYDRGLEWYRSLMPPTSESQVTVEKTPSYFVTSSVPSRMYNMSRTVKLILVIRDPVTRAISDYTQAAAKRRESRTFDEMAFLDNSTGPVATSWGAIRIGLYAKHLERWLQYFPVSQFHFVHGERLIDDPAAEMALIEDFLGVRRVVTEKYFFFNATKGFPCLRKAEGAGSPHCLGKTKGRVHPVVEEKVLQRLRHFYRPFNEKFYQMTGVNFGWS